MSTNADLILGLDAGTSVVKAALFDRGGRDHLLRALMLTSHVNTTIGVSR